MRRDKEHRPSGFALKSESSPAPDGESFLPGTILKSITTPSRNSSSCSIPHLCPQFRSSRQIFEG